jgi:tetratricopeptide (TPR) repeat protein
MFSQAIALDQRYATPHALTALWYSIRIAQGWSADLVSDRVLLSGSAQNALDRDPFDARALALCGHVRALQFHDYEGALALFDRAIASSPNCADAWIRSSPTYSYLGDGDEAKRRAHHGQRLSPLDAHMFFTHAVLCLAYYCAGEFEDAIRWGQKALGQNANFTANLRLLAASLAAAGRLAEAREVGRRLIAAEPGFRVAAFCAVYAFRDPWRRTSLGEHLLAAGLPR